MNFASELVKQARLALRPEVHSFRFKACPKQCEGSGSLVGLGEALNSQRR